MPIPFILGALAVGAGAYGVKKGLDAKEKMDEAGRIGRRAQRLADRTQKDIEQSRNITQHSLENLGQKKIDILDGSIKDFVSNFSKIKNVNFKNSVGLEELGNINFSKDELNQLKNASFQASEIATGLGGGAAAGALAGYGAFSAVGMLGAASTGTAISTLGGAAATNATLAWLGGGSLAAGGFGMAGGMAVLGGIVAGPALAIGGIFMNSKAETALNDAKSNYDEARKFEQQGKNICSLLEAIEERANQIHDLLSDLNAYFKPSVRQLANVVRSAGTNWNDYSVQDKKIVGQSAQLAKTIKIILDTSLLREDGSINSAVDEVIENGNKSIKLLEG